MKKMLISLLIAALLLTACGPTGPSQEEIATQVAEQVAAQLTALAPSPTPVPTDTPGITPVAIYTPLPPRVPTPTDIVAIIPTLKPTSAALPDISTDLSVAGETLWVLDLTGEIRQAPTIGPDGTVYVVTHAGVLYALDPAGTVQWSTILGGVRGIFTNYTSAAVAPDGRILVMFDDELLTYGADGMPSWTWRKPGVWGLTSLPAFAVDGTAYVMRNDSSLWAISPEGEELWGCTLCGWMGATTWPGPAVGPDGTVYAACKGDDVYAVDPVGGDIRWTYHTNDKMESTPAVGRDGTAYFASDGGWLFALQPDGQVLWTTSVAGPSYKIAIIDAPLALGPDGTVYVPAGHGTLYAVNPDGTIRWQAEVGGLDGYPVAVASDGSVYASTTPGRELVHISAKGDVLWRVQLTSDKRVRVSPPAVGPDGRLYIGVGQRLYAIQTGGYPTSIPPTPTTGAAWNCSGNLYNCSDFSSCAQVMSYWRACPGDPSRLDGDHDGIPCEALCD